MKRAGLLVSVAIVCVGMDGNCGGPAGLESMGCATRVAPPGLSFELIVVCGFLPNNEFLSPIGNELFIQAFTREPSDGTNIIVSVVPPSSGGSGVNEEFNEFTATGPFTSSFGVALETFNNVIQSQGIRQFLAAVELPDGNFLVIGVTGFIGDAAFNLNTAELIYRSVKFTQ